MVVKGDCGLYHCLPLLKDLRNPSKSIVRMAGQLPDAGYHYSILF
jgi:hypothetical protein